MGEEIQATAEALARVRQLSRAIQRSAGQPASFRDITEALSRLIHANVYLVNLDGELVGKALEIGFECEILEQVVLRTGRFPPDYAEGLLRVADTVSNIRQSGRKCVFDRARDCIQEGKITTIVPVFGRGERLGTLLLARFDRPFTDADLILAEYGSTIAAIEFIRQKQEESQSEERLRNGVRLALATLSFSELDAIEHICTELGGSEGLLVASKIADQAGITRSVIVNALRKLESAGIIASRSLGMKGTYIRILNPFFLTELRHAREESARV